MKIMSWDRNMKFHPLKHIIIVLGPTVWCEYEIQLGVYNLTDNERISIFYYFLCKFYPY